MADQRSVGLVELLHAMEDGLFGGLLHLAREEELVEDHVHLVEVEDQVELAHVAKELVAAARRVRWAEVRGAGPTD